MQPVMPIYEAKDSLTRTKARGSAMEKIREAVDQFKIEGKPDSMMSEE